MAEQKSIKDFTDVELKALYFDEMAQLEQHQANMKAILGELRLRNVPQPDAMPVEDKEATTEEKEA